MKRKIIFIAVGVFNTLADYAIYMVLQAALPISAQVAGVISATILMPVAFLLHKNFTWRDRGATNRAIGLFLLGTAITMWPIRFGLMWLFGLLTPFYAWVASWLTIFGEDFIARTGVFGFTTLVTLVLNYLWYHLVVFREQPRAAAAAKTARADGKHSIDKTEETDKTKADHGIAH